ncbi:MAG: hypothetical protein KC449_05475 [Anaerolineales bacterium]|nr:hypothetical protein [Anaerolineales bacterium]MCB8939239.1 hypothetical protein [Ardenticatenaceae bacterium]
MNSNANQTQQPDPAKAIVLKPHQKTRQRKQRNNSSQTWQPHQSSVALDGWGVALRTLREQGHQYE